MPGDLIEGHAKLESGCSNCHESFSKTSQKRLCLDCHEDVAKDVSDSRGFHGKWPEVSKQECSHCHTDHIGRDANIVLIDEDTFDHLFTDFPLKGSHKNTTCNDCHEAGKPFSKTPNLCVDCHEDDDRHEGNLGRDCASCHSEVRWIDTTSFDHSTTKFPLIDSHKSVNCVSCHIGEVYKDLPAECVDCHKIQDVHGSVFGEKCETCHAPSKWNEVKFDHDVDTKFVLLGKHSGAKCEACHTSNAYIEKLSTNCIDCHREDDPHKGQLGSECQACHSSENWREEVIFDHDITRFPLIGLHALVPCESCHLSSAFQDASLECVDCHAKETYHEGRLGSECDTCHNPNGWKNWVFDHNLQTGYKLTGAHDGLDCHACHTKARAPNLKISQSCIECHSDDDVHRGQFGENCWNCHTTGTFKDVKLRIK